MALSNKRLLLSFLWEKGFSMDSGTVLQNVFEPWTLHNDDLWWVYAFTDDIFASVMSFNIIDKL